VPVLQSRCFPEEGQLAYAPLLDALRQATRQGLARRLEGTEAIWLSETARLLPELQALFPGLPQPAALADPAAKSRLFESVHQVMGRLLGTGVLFLDDLHHADRASREWLGYVLRRGAGHPLLILAAWRVDGPQDSEALRAWLATLPAERTQELRLARLTKEDLRDLVMGRIDDRKANRGFAAANQAEVLYQETEGLPLLLGEYLTSGAEGASPPRQAQEAFARRLTSVGGAALQLLGAGAVIGRSFGLEILRQISGRSEEEVVAGLDELVTAGLVAEQPAADPTASPAYDFTHNKLRAAALQGLTQARRRLLHRRAAEALQALAAPGAWAAQIARHLAAAGRETAAAESYLQAAEQARTLHANGEAADHYAAALALGHPDPARLHEALGDLSTLRGHYREAVRHYETAVAVQEGLLLGRLEHKLGNVFQRWGQWEQAEARYASALSQLGEADQGRLARLYADWSLAAHRQGDPAKARQLLGKGLRAAEAAGDDLALAQCINMLGILDRAEGRLEPAEQHLQRSLSIARQLEDPGAQIAALNNLALAQADRGDWEPARAHTEEALALCRTIGDRHRQAALHSNLADLLHRAGQPEPALAELKKSAALFAEVGAQEGEYLPEIWKLVEW
jgi:predicted ATPase